MLTKARLFLADMEISLMEEQLKSIEEDYYARKIDRQRLYSRYTFEQAQPKHRYGRDAVVALATFLAGLIAFFTAGL